MKYLLFERYNDGRKPDRALKFLKRLFLLCLCLSMAVPSPFFADEASPAAPVTLTDQEVAEAAKTVVPNSGSKVNCWVGNSYYGPDGKRVKGLTLKKILQKSTKKEIRKKRKLIIVGASRVVQMAAHVKDDVQTVYIARSGAAFKWFKSTGRVKLRAYLQIFPRSTVVIQLGNNSLKKCIKNPEKYFNYYRELMADFPDAEFYLMDALPSRNKKKNKLRKKFNALLKEAFPDQYIKGYSYMVKHKYQTTSDGEHYTYATSVMIYNYILKKVKWKS